MSINCDKESISRKKIALNSKKGRKIYLLLFFWRNNTGSGVA